MSTVVPSKLTSTLAPNSAALMALLFLGSGALACAPAAQTTADGGSSAEDDGDEDDGADSEEESGSEADSADDEDEESESDDGQDEEEEETTEDSAEDTSTSAGDEEDDEADSTSTTTTDESDTAEDEEDSDPDTTDPSGDDTGIDTAGDNGAGRYMTGDWGGCVWTGVGEFGASTIEPMDFVGKTAGEPFCVTGSVGADEEWRSVALLGFNLGEAADADCSYKPPEEVGTLPAVSPTESGIAIDFAKEGEFTLRLQIQGPDGSTDENQRWCADLVGNGGKAFVEYSEFNTQCWTGGEGVDYNGEPLAAVVLTVPGEMDADLPFDFCVNGFADGNSAADAPDGSAVLGDQTGTLGENDRDFDRALVSVDGHNYVVQNNHWLDNGDLVLNFTNNSFQVTSSSGSEQNGAPFAFPSVFIGSNGFTDGGQYSTAQTDDLPIAISQIGAIPTRFAWGGSNGTFNATYDVWFASPNRQADLDAVQEGTKQYNDGLDGFLMVWLHNQGGEQPIGMDMGDASIANNNWDVWVGDRGNGPASDNADVEIIASEPGANVVSYVIKGSSLNSLEFDLKDFIDHAVSSGHLDGTFLLTDVFAGFEIWSGGSDLSVQEFRADVQPN